MRKPAYFTYIAARNKSSKSFFAVMLLFCAFCLASFIYFLVENQIRNSLMALLFIFLVPLIYALEMGLKLRFVTPFISLVLFIALGSLLGSGYDLYTLVPWFDTLLHCISGFIFACLGFAILELFIGEAENKKSFAACLLFGFVFSLAVALLWELFEYLGTHAFGLDMQEDTVVNGFNSYLLSGTHAYTFDVEGITQTVIYFGNGQSVVIDGYLDLGLIDTIADMAICLLGAVVYAVAIAIDWCKSKRKILFKAFVPHLIVKISDTELEYKSSEQPSMNDLREEMEVK